MAPGVSWISPTQLEFDDRIYTWFGRCWADRNGVSRTSYLVGKGIIVAGYNGGDKDKKLVGGMKGKNNKFPGANMEAVIHADGDNEGVRKEPVVHNKVGGKMGNDTDNEGHERSAFEQLCLIRVFEQLSNVFGRFPVQIESYDV